MRRVDVVIIGAGSAGLSALRQVQEQTDSYLLVDDGPLGTTCARVGCMPSKVLIHVAREYRATKAFAASGIRGAEGLSCDLPAVLRHVRRLRDRFTAGMVDTTRELAGDRLVRAHAEFESAHRVRVGDESVETDAVIIAAGARPVVPGPWRVFGNRILTSETLFEQEDLPRRMAVIGLGPIGLELGQALSRLGLEVTGLDMQGSIGGLTDSAVNRAARDAIGAEFPLRLGVKAVLEADGAGIRVSGAEQEPFVVDAVIAAMGVRPNLAPLRLDRLGVELNADGLPPFDCRTMQVGDLPVYIAGDASRCRPILHEALDEGYIAGRNSLADTPRAYCRRVPLRIVFSEPQLVVVGSDWEMIAREIPEAVTGEVDFADQSRAIVEGKAAGLLRVYAHPETGRLLGAELAAPQAEHLGHQLATMLQNGMTVTGALQLPYYHPCLEEALRSALRAVREQCSPSARQSELLVCDSGPEPPLR